MAWLFISSRTPTSDFISSSTEQYSCCDTSRWPGAQRMLLLPALFPGLRGLSASEEHRTHVSEGPRPTGDRQAHGAAGTEERARGWLRRGIPPPAGWEGRGRRWEQLRPSGGPLGAEGSRRGGPAAWGPSLRVTRGHGISREPPSGSEAGTGGRRQGPSPGHQGPYVWVPDPSAWSLPSGRGAVKGVETPPMFLSHVRASQKGPEAGTRELGAVWGVGEVWPRLPRPGRRGLTTVVIQLPHAGSDVLGRRDRMN